MLGSAGLAVFALVRNGAMARGPTWGCGYLCRRCACNTRGVVRGDDRRAPAAAFPSAPDDTVRLLAGPFPAKMPVRSGCPDPVHRAGLYDPFFRRWAGSLFPASHSPAGERSTSIWCTWCSRSCWRWPGYPFAGATEVRHERIARCFWAIIVAALSGLPGFLRGTAVDDRPVGRPRCSPCSDPALGLVGTGAFWMTGKASRSCCRGPSPAPSSTWPWMDFPPFFLAPIFLISLLGNVYGLGYWKQTEHPRNGRKLRLFYGMMTAGMALAGHRARTASFSSSAGRSWALSALLSDHDGKTRRRRPGSRLALPGRDPHRDALLCSRSLRSCVPAGLVRARRRSDDDALGPNRTTAIFALARARVSASKAGIMPLHIWLPGAPCGRAQPCLGIHVRRPHQDGHLRAVPCDITLAGSAAGLGCDRPCVRSGVGRPWGRVCNRSTRSEAAARLSQHREHRHHRDRHRPGYDRPFARPCRIG